MVRESAGHHTAECLVGVLVAAGDETPVLFHPRFGLAEKLEKTAADPVRRLLGEGEKLFLKIGHRLPA